MDHKRFTELDLMNLVIFNMPTKLNLAISPTDNQVIYLSGESMVNNCRTLQYCMPTKLNLAIYPTVANQVKYLSGGSLVNNCRKLQYCMP